MFGQGQGKKRNLRSYPRFTYIRDENMRRVYIRGENGGFSEQNKTQKDKKFV